MLSVNNLGALEIIESRCQSLSKCISGSLSPTATEAQYLVPETFRIRFLVNQPELLSQNTCWLYRRASADHVTARVNPEQRIESKPLQMLPTLCTSWNWPLVFIWSSWWSMCGSWKNSSHISCLHSIITQSVSQETKQSVSAPWYIHVQEMC